MKELIIFIVIFHYSCSPKPFDGVYFKEPKVKDISQPKEQYDIINTPHFEPIRGNQISNDLVLKYQLMYKKSYNTTGREHSAFGQVSGFLLMFFLFR